MKKWMRVLLIGATVASLSVSAFATTTDAEVTPKQKAGRMIGAGQQGKMGKAKGAMQERLEAAAEAADMTLEEYKEYLKEEAAERKAECEAAAQAAGMTVEEYRESMREAKRAEREAACEAAAKEAGMTVEEYREAMRKENPRHGAKGNGPKGPRKLQEETTN